MSDTATSADRSDATPGHDASSTLPWTDPQRQDAFARWLVRIGTEHGLAPASLRLASADASFRRYLRIDSAAGTRIIMDAPPDKENCAPFVQIAALMADAGLRVPQVLDWDQPHGFLLLTDLGRQTMIEAIDRDHAQANLDLYRQAVDTLVCWQRASRPEVLPPYDAALLRRELDLFPQWYLQQHRAITPDARMLETLATTFDHIVRENLSWPSVYVHRDFMPRNLMMPAPGQAPASAASALGVLDFQDAVYGPITYDIASLMRDAFLSWDEEFVLDVTIRYWEKARAAGLPVGADFGAFYRGVEWMGLQRHLKVAGIFARLTLRDGKPQYLADAPRFIRYIRATAARYRELKPLLRLVDQVEGITERSGFAYGRM
jgi:aminoglycoside/choline kinase family phosphotransferase